MPPVERKVQASTAAAAASGLVLFVLGRYVFKGAVPDVIASWVYAAVPAVLAFAAGYFARHTARPDLAPPPPPGPAPGVKVFTPGGGGGGGGGTGSFTPPGGGQVTVT